MISYSAEASQHLQELLDEYGDAGYVVTLTLANNAGTRLVKLQPTPPGNGFHGRCFVRDFNNETQECSGDAYWVDLFGEYGLDIDDILIY